MTVKYTNEYNINPIMAAWLISNDYTSGSEKFPDKTVISATTLLKPTRQYILSKEVKDYTVDISDLIPAKLGKAVHDSLESFFLFLKTYSEAFRELGWSDEEIDNIVVNPLFDLSTKTNIHVEERYFKEIPNTNIVISGQVDLIADGYLIDYKTTSVFTYMYQKNVEKYKLQGSIYRWLNPKIITENFIAVQYIFTDWQSALAKSNPNYPQIRVLEQVIELYSLEETEKFILDKLKEIKHNESLTDQSLMIRCNDDDLWMSETKYKYFSDPTKINGRSTKNFTDFVEAQRYLSEKGKGTIIIDNGIPKACPKCKAFSICEQRKEYYSDITDLYEDEE